MIWKLYHFLPCNYVLNEILHVLAWLIKNCREPGELICRFIKSHPLWWSLYLKIQPVNAGDTWILCNRRSTRYKLLFFPIPQVYYLPLSCWSVYLSIYILVFCLFFNLSCWSVYLWIYLAVCLFVYLSCCSVYFLSILSFCLFGYLYLAVLSICLNILYLTHVLWCLSIRLCFCPNKKCIFFYPICLLCLIYLFFF